MRYQKGLVVFVALFCITNAAADELTAMIERDLAALGYETGNVDGEADMRTAIAISQFQAENGLEVTGEVSPQLAGILANEVKKSGASSPPPTTAAATTSTVSAASSEQACLQQKIAAAEQQQAPKKKGLGGMFSSLSKTVAKYGNNEIAEVTSEVYEASATVNDLAAAARDLGITESEIAECTSGSSSSQVAAASGTAGSATVPVGSVDQTSTQASWTTFVQTADQLALHDASIEKCQGAREDFRSQFDSLISVAHPDYREMALLRYDNAYSMWKNFPGQYPGLTDPCSRAEANQLLLQLGGGTSASTHTQTSGPDTANSSVAVANAPNPKSTAFELAISRTQTLLEACQKILEENPGVSLGEFTGGRGTAPLPASEIERKQESHMIAMTCVSDCRGAQYKLNNARSDQPIEAFASYVQACESSYAKASAL